MQVVGPEVTHTFVQFGYKVEVPRTPPLASINLLEWLPELREFRTHSYEYQFSNGNDKECK